MIQVQKQDFYRDGQKWMLRYSHLRTHSICQHTFRQIQFSPTLAHSMQGESGSIVSGASPAKQVSRWGHQERGTTQLAPEIRTHSCDLKFCTNIKESSTSPLFSGRERNSRRDLGSPPPHAPSVEEGPGWGSSSSLDSMAGNHR